MQKINKSEFYILISRYFPIVLIKYLLDVGSLVISLLLAKYILHIPLAKNFSLDTVFLVSASILAAYAYGIYHHLWRFTSLYNILGVFKYCLTITVVLTIWYNFIDEWNESLLKLCFLFMTFAFSSLNLIRVFIRITFENIQFANHKKGINAIIIGAGRGGELFIRESKKRAGEAYNIEGILDDDPNLWGRKLFGIKVYGPIKDLAKIAGVNEIQIVIIAIPSLAKEKIIDVNTTAKELGLLVRVLPSFDSLLVNKEMAPEDISVEDLLGRESVNLDKDEASKFIKDKIILVTGAGGSIGSEICRQIIPLEPKSIIMIDHSEYNLYKISWELEHTIKYPNFLPILANTGDSKVMEAIFETHKPQVIFHAAAYKHVPLLEKQTKQAIINNFFSTKSIAELASKYKTEKFIFISTDKAVNPTNIMGTTKRMAEIFCQNFNHSSQTNYIIVRFGNVLGSDGSVVPLFKRQLKQGGPLTVTHPEITRFFMSIPEASQLVLQAGAMGTGGEIFVLDMGKPVKISDLAERLISLSGKRPYKDVEIVFTGLRPGEKLYEELFYEHENHISTKHKKIFLANSISHNFQDFLTQTVVLEQSLNRMDEGKLIGIVCQMVPEAIINLSFKPLYGVDQTNEEITA